jgi:hypothetical protein
VIGEDTAEGTEGGDTTPKPDNVDKLKEEKKAGDQVEESEADNSYFLNSAFIQEYHQQMADE